MNTPEKIKFALDINDDWPPVSTESVWCELINGNYKLVNTPFFIPNIAFGDIFTAIPDEVNGLIFEFTVIQPSGHSVVWGVNTQAIEVKPFTNAMRELDCKVEGFPQFHLYSIDVPPKVNLVNFNELVNDYEEQGFEFAFPTWRHKD